MSSQPICKMNKFRKRKTEGNAEIKEMFCIVAGRFQRTNCSFSPSYTARILPTSFSIGSITYQFVDFIVVSFKFPLSFKKKKKTMVLCRLKSLQLGWQSLNTFQPLMDIVSQLYSFTRLLGKIDQLCNASTYFYGSSRRDPIFKTTA